MHGLGLVVAVSSTLTFGYAIVESADRVNRRVALRDLKGKEIAFPAVAQPYETSKQRVAYGVWDEVHALIPAMQVLAVGSVSRHYTVALEVDMNEPALVPAAFDLLRFNFDVTLHYQNGFEETLTLERATLVPNWGRLYLSLKETAVAPLTSLEVHVPTEVLLESDVQLCAT